MKKSVYTWFGFYLPITERLALIKNTGFDGVMLPWEDEYPPFEFSRFETADLAQKLGLEITNTHGPFEGYNAVWQKDDPTRSDFFKRIKKQIKECGQAGIRSVVLHTSDRSYSPIDLEAGKAFFGDLIEEAEKRNVILSVENVSRPYLNRFLYDHFDSLYLGFCYDSGHDYMVPCGHGKLLNDYKHRLTDVHLHDNNFINDKHWIPLEGQINFEPIVETLKEQGLDTLCLEVVADPKFWVNKKPEEFLQKSYDALKLIET